MGMRIKNPKKKSRKIWIISLVTILLVASGVGVYSLWFKGASQKNNDTTKSRSSENNPSAGKTDEDNATIDSSGHEAEKDIEAPYEGENTNNSQSLTGVITYTGVTDGTLMIRTTINQTISTGTCRLTLSKGSKTVTRDSGIAQNPSSSTCQGFDVSTAELGSGKWNITITITSGDRSGELKGNVTI